ncbi:nuclear pore protein 84/107 [Lipomyces arxii]|uniref:nuclear pore protein 84/107 n=1 Tax=Lipomyces arxii TaxID=56418 RepID=UPI0034CFB3BA
MPIEVFTPGSGTDFDGGATPRRGKRRPRMSFPGHAERSFMNVNNERSEMEEFANAFERYSKASDPFDVIRAYIRISASRADKLQLADASPEEIETWEIERRTWSLIETLYSFRERPDRPPMKIYKSTSNTIAEESFYRQHKEARENLLVISWLQNSLPNTAGPELRGVKWQMTRAQVKQKKVQFSTTTAFGFRGKQSGLVMSLDVDAPLRENAAIHPEDADFERALLRQIYWLLATGKFDELREICEATGDYTLLAAINGMVEYRDPIIDGVALNSEEHVARGTKRKALWRRMCLQLAKSSQIDRYERAIYGLLCGDLESVVAVSDSWESQLLAYVQHLVATEVESFFKYDGRLNIANPDLLPFPQSQAKSIGDILNTLSQSSSDVIRAQSSHPMRHIQGGIMNNAIELIIADACRMIENVTNGAEDTNMLLDNPYLLRFLAHFVLFLRAIGIEAGSPELSDSIIAIYTEDLTAHDKKKLVPLYISFLPEEMAIEAYSFLLADVTDARTRAEQFALAEKYDLDLINTLRRTIQRVFDDHEDEYPAIESHTEMDLSTASEIDRRLSSSLMWFVDARLWDDIVRSANDLYLRFLLAGKVGSAERFRAQLGQTQLYDVLADFEEQAEMPLDEDEAMNYPTAKAGSEFNEFDRFVTGMAMIREWNNVYSERPKGGDRVWRLRAREVIERIKEPLIDLVTSWMVANFDAERFDAIHRLRVLYVPYLLIETTRILTEAKAVDKIYPMQALSLVNMVASEEVDVYKLLVECGRLDEYLVSVASVSLVVGADPANGIWRV